MSKFTNKKGKLRLYDGTATPWYLEIDFDGGDFSGPMGIPKAEEILVLDRQKLTEDAHYITGSDEKLVEPVAITFTAMIVDLPQCLMLLDFLEQLSNGNGASPIVSAGAVNLHTLTTTKGTTMRDGVTFSPAFEDGSKMACNLEYRLDGPTTDIVWKYNEVMFPLGEQSISEAEDAVTISINGQCHGTITRGTAFTTGTSIET